MWKYRLRNGGYFCPGERGLTFHSFLSTDPYSGGSADWCRGVAGIKYCYLIELRDTGVYGFLLPPAEIIPTGEEIWAGVQVVADAVIDYADREHLFERFGSTTAQVMPTTSVDDDEMTTAGYMTSDKDVMRSSSTTRNSDGMNDSRGSVEQTIPVVEPVVDSAAHKSLTSSFIALLSILTYLYCRWHLL